MPDELICNIACGERVSIIGIVDRINRILETNIRPNFVGARVGDVKHSLADITLARKALDFEPKVDLEEGLRRTISWIKR